MKIKNLALISAALAAATHAPLSNAQPRQAAALRHGPSGVDMRAHNRLMCGKRQRQNKLARKSRAINRRSA